MARSITITLAVLLALVVASCDSGDTVQPSTNGKIVGHVTDGSNPVAGASIQTVPATSSLLSKTDGSFTIENVPPGTYVVSASKVGLNPGSVAIAVLAGKSSQAEIVLSAGAANRPPAEPASPLPVDNAVAQPTDLTLRWSCSDPDGDAVTYDVYFGPTSPPALVSTNQPQRVHYVSGLDSSKTYFWQIIARDAKGAVSGGPVWRFRTSLPNENKAPYLPTSPRPADAALGQATDVVLRWVTGDPDGDPVQCDVYFGTTMSPAKVAESLTSPELRRSNLAPSSVYYWKVVVRDNHGGEVSGPLWSFATGDTTTPPPPPPPVDNLVAYFPFEGDARDATGRGHDGTVFAATLTTDRHGAAASAYRFVKSSRSRITVPHHSELNMPGASFSVCAWVLLEGDQSEYTGIVAKGPEDVEYPGWMLLSMNGSAGGDVIGTATGEPNYVVERGSTALGDGRWHFLTLVVDASKREVSLWVDGRLERRRVDQDLSLNFQSTKSMMIGCERNADVYFNGSIDDVRLYSKALSAAEIDALSKQ